MTPPASRREREPAVSCRLAWLARPGRARGPGAGRGLPGRSAMPAAPRHSLPGIRGRRAPARRRSCGRRSCQVTSRQMASWAGPCSAPQNFWACKARVTSAVSAFRVSLLERLIPELAEYLLCDCVQAPGLAPRWRARLPSVPHSLALPLPGSPAAGIVRPPLAWRAGSRQVQVFLPRASTSWDLPGNFHEVAVPSGCAGQGRTVRDGHCCCHRVVLAW
jgi:hypothetical protein